MSGDLFKDSKLFLCGCFYYNKLIYFLFSLVLLVGCNDAIDIRQPGRLDAGAAFETVADLQAGLLGVYDNFDTTPEIAFSSVFTDELSIGFDSGGQGLQDYAFTLNAGSTAPANFWTRNYAAINSANRLIEAAALIEAADSAEQAQLNNILGQAFFLRAYAHMELISYFTVSNECAVGKFLFQRYRRCE